MNRRSFLKALKLAPAVVAVAQFLPKAELIEQDMAPIVMPVIKAIPDYAWGIDFARSGDELAYVGGHILPLGEMEFSEVVRWSGDTFQGIQQLITTGYR